MNPLDPMRGLTEAEIRAVKKAAKLLAKVRAVIVDQSAGAWHGETPEDILAEASPDWRRQARMMQATIDHAYETGALTRSDRAHGTHAAWRRPKPELPTEVADDALKAALARIRSHGLTHEYVALTVEAGTEARSVRRREVAETLGITEGALTHRLSRADAPDTTTMLRWGRLLIVAQAYRIQGCSLLRAGRAAGYTTSSATSNAWSATTSMTATEWKSNGGDMDALVDAMVATWRGDESEEQAA